MNLYDVIITPQAESQLENIAHYIAVDYPANSSNAENTVFTGL